MARQKVPSFIELWAKHQKLYLEVFAEALRELTQRESPLSGDENDISKVLNIKLNEVCFKFSRERRNKDEEIRTPVPQKPISPVSEDEMNDEKIGKIPDFTCSCSNKRAESGKEYEIPLHVECKRLGSPTSPSWNLNENYVINGIKRFDCKTFGYGEHAPSGMMIGYIISMTPKKIEAEVKNYQNKHLPGYPELQFHSDAPKVFQAHQHLQRQSVEPAQFELLHLWGDLRERYRT